MSLKNKYDFGGILYLIDKGGSEGFPFRIRLQKMILLAKLEESFPFSFKYESYHYGPYSFDLQNDLEAMINDGLVREKVIATGEDSSGFVYSITPKGEEILSNISLSASDIKKIDDLWSRYSKESTEYIVKKAKEVSGIKSISD